MKTQIPTTATDEIRAELMQKYLVTPDEADDLYEQVIRPELVANAEEGR